MGSVGSFTSRHFKPRERACSIKRVDLGAGRGTLEKRSFPLPGIELRFLGYAAHIRVAIVPVIDMNVLNVWIYC